MQQIAKCSSFDGVIVTAGVDTNQGPIEYRYPSSHRVFLALIRTGIEGIEGMVQGGSSIACGSRGRHAMPVL